MGMTDTTIIFDDEWPVVVLELKNDQETLLWGIHPRNLLPLRTPQASHSYAGIHLIKSMSRGHRYHSGCLVDSSTGGVLQRRESKEASSLAQFRMGNFAWKCGPR